MADLADRQHGVACRGQLRAVGWTDDQIAAAMRSRRWRAFGRYCVIFDNAPLTDAQRLWVAVLLPGKPCALAGATAATHAGLRGFGSEQVEIVVRHATHVAAPSWVKLHESRRFTDTDIVRRAGLPTVTTTRAVVDAAAWSRAPRRACAFLCAAVQQRLTTADALSAELSLAGRVRHAAVMHNVLRDIAGGGHTLAEIDLAGPARRAGLPAPRRQALRRDPNGKARYLDAEFTLPDGTVMAVEVDGQGHLDPMTWTDDLSRQNEVVIGRTPVLRFASVTVRLAAGAVEDQLRRMRIAHTP